jgi:RNA 2',3'-cyclic 3'-phosphodiesterase
MENKIIRAFFAIILSELCRQNLSEIILQLKKEMPSVIKWVDINNVHLTLKFMGKLNSRDIDPMKKRLEIAFSGFDQFNLKLFNLGLFPNERNPKIIWVGASISDQLKQLFAILEETAFSYGYSTEQRDFTPHFTIGRVKENVITRDLLQIGRIMQGKKECEICISKVKGFTFFQSELTPTGPIYSELFSIPFNQ